MSTPTLAPDQIHALQARAANTPDEPVATGSEVAALIADLRAATNTAAAYERTAKVVTEVATEWAGSLDVQRAAAGHIVLAAQTGRTLQAVTGLI